MSNFYLARVSNAGLDNSLSDFTVLVKADSISQARAGVMRNVIDVERATDSEIFEAGRNGSVVLNLSDMPTDDVHPDQQPLLVVDTQQGEACVGEEANATTTFKPSTGSAPAWLPPRGGNAPAIDTGD